MKIKDVIGPEQVEVGLRVSDKAQLLRELSHRAAAAVSIDQSVIHDALLAGRFWCRSSLEVLNVAQRARGHVVRGHVARPQRIEIALRSHSPGARHWVSSPRGSACIPFIH